MASTIDNFRAECELAGAKKQAIKTAKKMIEHGRFLIQKLLVLQI